MFHVQFHHPSLLTYFLFPPVPLVPIYPIVTVQALRPTPRCCGTLCGAGVTAVHRTYEPKGRDKDHKIGAQETKIEGESPQKITILEKNHSVFIK